MGARFLINSSSSTNGGGGGGAGGSRRSRDRRVAEDEDDEEADDFHNFLESLLGGKCVYIHTCIHVHALLCVYVCDDEGDAGSCLMLMPKLFFHRRCRVIEEQPKFIF